VVDALAERWSAMDEQMTQQFLVLQARRTGLIDYQKVDEVRRVLWRAFQHGALSEDELASTLERLEFGELETAAQPEFASRH
jgi:hypothetical protein